MALFCKETKMTLKLLFSKVAFSSKSRPDLSTEEFPPNPFDFSRQLVFFSLSSHLWLRNLGRSSIAAASHNLTEPSVERLSPPTFSNQWHYPPRLSARGREYCADGRSESTH